MEVKEKSKKRELIKTIAIIFLVILLILTFFSNTFMNYSLPEVATQMVTSGTINAKIRGSGTVSANESYEVVINQTREVRSICVKVGDTVEQGDLLFVLGDMESEELKTAQDTLRNLELEYQRQILELAKSHATDDLTVQCIRSELERAIAQRDANVVTEAEISYAKGDLAQVQSELSQIESILTELKAVQAEAEGEDSAYAAASAKVAELEKKISELNDQIKADQENLKKLDEGDSLSKEWELQDARDTLDKAETKWAADWAAYADLLQHVGYYYRGRSPQVITSSEQVSIEASLARLERIPSDPSDPYDNGLDTAQIRTAYTTLIADQDAVDKAQTAYDRLVQNQNNAYDTTAQARRDLQQRINAAQQELSAAQRQLTAAQQERASLAGSNSQVKEQIRSYEAAQRDREARKKELETALGDLTAKQTLYQEALETIEAKEKQLQEALSGKDIDGQLEDLSLQSKQLEIQRQRELVAKLKEDSVDTEIKAKVSGVISAINVTAGKENTSGQPMATIDVVDRGYTIKISVTNEQAKQVKVGDTADVSNYRWGSDINAVLEAITSDPSAPGQKKLLVFRLTGDVEAGANITLSVGQRSTVMDTIVPKSALREDTNGKFVFVVTSRSTPLGNRYTATRVDVQVLAEDDNNVAVSGVAANDYVITTASKPLSAGDLVRMVENP